jgi:hypothetical protein
VQVSVYVYEDYNSSVEVNFLLRVEGLKVGKGETLCKIKGNAYGEECLCRTSVSE